MSIASVVVKTAPRAPKRAPAAKTKLAEGEHSIDRANVRISGDKKLLDWRILLPGEAEPVAKRTQGKKTDSNADVKAKAKRVAEEMLRTGGKKAEWTPASSIGAFAREVVAADIEKASIADRSKDQYRGKLALLLGDCDEHAHPRALGRRTIRAGIRYEALEDCLMEISELHGGETARQARTVMSGYLVKALKRRDLVSGNPLQGERIDLKANARPHTGRKGNVALREADYHRVLEYLIALDPSEGVVKPKRGRWSLADRIAKRRNAVDLTLLQAGTGLRLNEVRQVRRELVIDDADGLRINVVKEIAKNRIPRVAYVFDDGVAQRLRERLAEPGAPSDPVIGSPHRQSVCWDRRNLSEMFEELYLEMMHVLGIAEFEHERSHVWRATLNTLLKGTVPDAMLEAQFGHTADVNRSHYTDTAMPPEVARAAIGRLANK